MSIRICCPHCSGYIKVDLSLTQDGMSKPHGPAPYNPGPKVDAFIIDAIENRRLSLRTVGELLREQGVVTATGKTQWTATGVQKQYEHALKRQEVRA
ncbi:MAG TPA: hypothetical protein VN843_14900 [Anaerolineales bacterium]|nr:hypothetical protein [Anaerolineales bacterium]